MLRVERDGSELLYDKPASLLLYESMENLHEAAEVERKVLDKKGKMHRHHCQSQQGPGHLRFMWLGFNAGLELPRVFEAK